MLFNPIRNGYDPSMEIMATYTVEAFMASYAWGNWKILAISALTFFFGYMEYIYSFRLVAREKSAPYPMWMHTFYFAHDFTGVVCSARWPRSTTSGFSISPRWRW